MAERYTGSMRRPGRCAAWFRTRPFHLTRASVVVLVAAACGGGNGSAPAPKPTTTFADVERCLYAISSTRNDIDAFASACGGIRAGTPWDRVSAGAAWLARRRADVVRAGNKPLVQWIDFVVHPVAFRLPEEIPVVDLPISTETRPRMGFLTLVTIDKVEHQAIDHAVLSLTSSPPVERESFRARGLLMADRSLPAARLLEVAFAPAEDHAFIAVRTPDGGIAAHRIWFDPVRHGNAYRLDLGPDATVAELVAALDDAAAKGFSTASWWRFE